MGCLNDYIGIRWCGGSASAPSSLYINDLPGLSIKQFNSITDEENGTFLSVWNTVQNRAERRFALDVREAMGAKYRLKSLAQGFNLGNVVDSTTINTPLINVQNGFAIELIQADLIDWTPSPLLQMNVQQLAFYLDDAADISKIITIRIADLDTAEVYKQSTFTLVNQGWNIIPINLTITSTTNAQPLRIACQFITDGTVDCVSMDTTQNIQINDCCGAAVRPYSIAQGAFTSNTYGLSGIFNVTCSWEGLICQNKNLFSRAFWYLCGIEFLTELIYSTTLSKWTTIGMNQMKDLRAEYEVEYQKSLKQVADGMYLDCDCCLDCASPVQIRTAAQFF